MSRTTGLRLAVLSALLAAAAGTGAALMPEGPRNVATFAWIRVRGSYTVEERLRQHGPAVEARLRGPFAAAGLPYPPAELAYVAFKDTRRLEVYGRASPERPWRFVKAYPVLGASGGRGPKLAEGDEQVPEGIYRAESLTRTAASTCPSAWTTPTRSTGAWAGRTAGAAWAATS
jgi:hypothetical protein